MVRPPRRPPRLTAAQRAQRARNAAMMRAVYAAAQRAQHHAAQRDVVSADELAG